MKLNYMENVCLEVGGGGGRLTLWGEGGEVGEEGRQLINKEMGSKWRRERWLSSNNLGANFLQYLCLSPSD